MNKTFNIDEQFNQSLDEAENLFNNSGIFIYPTDTIYGIGGDQFNNHVKKRIVHLKKRDEAKKFILLAGSTKIIEKYVEIDSLLLEKLNVIWPAPVSLIFKLKKVYQDKLEQQTAAFRIPNNEFCKKLLDRINSLLISTSVNREGEKPLNNYKQIIENYSSKVDAVFYTLKQSPEVSSTVVDLTTDKPKLIREGEIKFMDLLKKLS